MKRTFVIICLMLACDLGALSQNNDQLKIASLKKGLPFLQDTARVDCLNALSTVYADTLNEVYVEANANAARFHALQALREAQKINYIKGQTRAYNNLGNIEWHLCEDLPLMETYFKKSLSLPDKTQNAEQRAAPLFMLGCAYWGQSKFSLAIEAFTKASLLFTRTADVISLAQTYNSMANVEMERGQYERSLQYSVRLFELSKKHNNIRGMGTWGQLYRNIGDYETALDYYQQNLQSEQNNESRALSYIWISETFYLQKKYDSARYYNNFVPNYTSQKWLLARLNVNLGELSLVQEIYDSALLYLNDALTYFKKANDRNQIMRVLLGLSNTYQGKKDYKTAMQYAGELLQTAQETGARQNIRNAHFLLYKLFERLQKRDSAYSHLQQYMVLKDSIDLGLSAQKLAFYKVKSETEKAQARIALVNKEKTLQQKQLKQTTQQKNFLIVGIALLLLTGVVLFRNISLRRKNEKLKLENELKVQQFESQKQLSKLEMQALRAQMNPHFIFNCLNSINRFIQKNNTEEASGYLTKFSKLIRLILQNSQAPLIPLESELKSLRLYLELEAVRFNHHFDYKIIIDEDLDVDILKVPPLIIQPYAENAIWHGLMHKEEKGHLQVELYQCDEVLYCKITDDGVGRQRAAELKSKSASTHKSMGMRITADRIAMLQEKKQIDTTIKITDLVLPDGSAGGTEVLLKIPLMQ